MEQRTVLFENRTVCFIDDDQIKSANAKFFGVLIDQPNHRLICRKNNSGVAISIYTAAGINGSRDRRQKLIEVLVRLCDKARAVGEKQHVPCPVRFQQYICQRNRHTRFACTGCHNEQAVAAVLRKGMTSRLNCRNLIRSAGNVCVNLWCRNFLPCGRTLFQALELLGIVKLKNAARRVNELVNDINMIAGRIVNDGAIAKFFRKLVRFFDALFSAVYNIFSVAVYSIMASGLLSLPFRT